MCEPPNIHSSLEDVYLPGLCGMGNLSMATNFALWLVPVYGCLWVLGFSPLCLVFIPPSLHE